MTPETYEQFMERWETERRRELIEVATAIYAATVNGADSLTKDAAVRVAQSLIEEVERFIDEKRRKAGK